MGEGEGKMGPPMPYIINCDMVLGSYCTFRGSNAKYFTVIIVFLKLHTCVKA